MAEKQVGPEYPKWRYKDGAEPKMVETAAEEKALGAGWKDNPGKPVAPPAKTAAELAQEKAAADAAKAKADADAKAKLAAEHQG